MKTLTIITIAAFTFATSAFAKSNDKFYEVTDNGNFQYTYWAEAGIDNVKAGIKPVTLRTFFLETEKNGLLPFEMSYSEFTNLTVEEKQAILEGSQYNTIAAMENREEIVTETATAIPSVISPVEAVIVTEERIEEAPAANTVAPDFKAPWLVKAITRPGTENNLNDGKVAITLEESDEFPWVVDLMVNEGKQIEAKYVAETVKTSRRLSASK